MNIHKILFLIMITIGFQSFGQEIIQEKVVVKDSIKKTGKKKIDGIVAQVGEFIILDSDIDLNYVEMQQSGIDTKNMTRGEMLSRLMEEKLFAHQALLDSTITVKDSEVRSDMEDKISTMIEQFGGDMDKLVKFYNKKNITEFRSFFFDVLKNSKLSREMQNKITQDLEITPEEVRTFFKKMKDDDLPNFSTEVEVAQILLVPKVSDAEKERIVRKLKDIKEEVLKGASFRSRAVLYSDDRGSSADGGFYKITKKTGFVKEFKDVAFSLNEGEISEPFETEFGYHIILLERIKGQELELRHILMMPKVSEKDLKETKEKALLIRKRIMDKELTFEEAAKQFSDEKETKLNGGQLINPRTQDTKFELTKIDPALYRQIYGLKQGEISNPILDEDPRLGKRYKLLTITNKIEEHKADYSIDYTKIRELALTEKRIKAIQKWKKENIQDTYVKINGDYNNYQFEDNWKKVNN
jgi:peptidyl-prolyl cis-trans isomerase SurA